MANPRAATANTPGRPAAQPGWYSAVVVGAAVFLGGLLVSHPPITGFQAEAVVVPARVSAGAAADSRLPTELEAIDLVSAEAWLKSDSTLQKLAAGSATSEVADGNGASLDLNGLRDHLQLEQADHEGKSRLIVRVVSRQRTTARRIADRAASELAAYLDRTSDNRPAETEIAALRREISLLDGQQARLEDELDQRRYEQLAETLAKDRAELTRRSSAESLAAERQAPQLQRRAQLTQKIDELRIEYRTLVATRLADHPRVAAVAGQIEQLEAQLSELPGSIPPEAENNRGPRLHVPAVNRAAGVTEARFAALGRADRSEEISANPNDLDIVRQQLQEVVCHRKDVEFRLETALRLASTIWQKQWTVAHAGPTKRIGGSPKSNDLMLAMLLGLMAAAAVGLDWSLLWGKRVLVSAAQARNTLTAPLLGEISLPAAQPTPVSERSRSTLKRRIVRMAEWMLIISLFLLILAAVSQRELAAQLARDPFGAMAEAFDTVRSAGW